MLYNGSTGRRSITIMTNPVLSIKLDILHRYVKFHHSEKNPGNLYLSHPNEYPEEPCSDAIQWFHWEEKFYNYDKPGYNQAARTFYYGMNNIFRVGINIDWNSLTNKWVIILSKISFPFSNCFKSVVNYGIALGAWFKACSAHGGYCCILGKLTTHSAATYVTLSTSVTIEAE